VSVLMVATITCDGCGDVIVGDPSRRSTQFISAYSSALDEAKRLGWVTLLRYGPAKHYCRKCADSPQAAIALEKGEK
jgi:hypothetical protein